MRMTLEQAREQLAKAQAEADEARVKVIYLRGYISALEPDDDDDDEASEPTPLRAVETGD